eukprot:TRINITY_DN3023_c0_g1_i1.p1 TRINITY_DN3023_c0_g1~~TRINITY_DN3023_c0_g1_i1.p1  ORF type:complete len:174 (-),score=9.11 TRINITY_DN3023_c0_g1_i1:366-887(-)
MIQGIIYCCIIITCFIALRHQLLLGFDEQKSKGIYYGPYHECYLIVNEEQDMLVQGQCQDDRQQLSLRKYKESKMWKIEVVEKLHFDQFELVKLMYAPASAYVRLDPLEEFGDFYANEKNSSLATYFAVLSNFVYKPTVITIVKSNTLLYAYFDQNYLTATQQISDHTSFLIL